MRTLIAWLSAWIAGSVAWWLGAKIGNAVAVLAGATAGAAGLWAGYRWFDQNLR